MEQHVSVTLKSYHRVPHQRERFGTPVLGRSLKQQNMLHEQKLASFDSSSLIIKEKNAPHLSVCRYECCQNEAASQNDPPSQNLQFFTFKNFKSRKEEARIC